MVGDFYQEGQESVTITEETASRFGGLDELQKQGFKMGDVVFVKPAGAASTVKTEEEKIWTDTKTGLRLDPVKSGIKVDDETGEISVEKLVLSEHQTADAVAAYKKLRGDGSVPMIMFAGTKPRNLELPGSQMAKQ